MTVKELVQTLDVVVNDIQENVLEFLEAVQTVHGLELLLGRGRRGVSKPDLAEPRGLAEKRQQLRVDRLHVRRVEVECPREDGQAERVDCFDDEDAAGAERAMRLADKGRKDLEREMLQDLRRENPSQRGGPFLPEGLEE